MKRKIVASFIFLIFLFSIFVGVIADLKMISPTLESKSEKWLIEIVDSNGETGWFSNINVFDENKVFITYYDRQSQSLRIAKLIDSNWIIDVVDSLGDVGKYTSVAVDSIGNPHISYYDIKNKDLKYATQMDNNWINTIVDSEGDVGLDTSIKVDKNDLPHISYYDYTNGCLKYARWSGSYWEIEIVDSTSNVGAGSCLVLDINDNPHISYKKVLEPGLKYSYKIGSDWIIDTIDPDSFVYGSTSISLDPYFRPHIAYFDVGTISEEWFLKYIYLNQNNWIIEIIDPEMKNVGWYDWGVSIDASKSDIIHVGYYKWPERDLNYAWRLNNKWSIETVDSDGIVGAYTSLDVGEDGYPQISYMDRGNLYLKYAKKIEFSPSKPFVPEGRKYGLTDEEYFYSTFSSDYDGDKIKYGWDWDDSSDIEWTDYYNSDELVELCHSWIEKGVYQIRVKAIDINGFESDWSDPLVISMSKTKSLNEFNPWILRIIQKFSILESLLYSC